MARYTGPSCKLARREGVDLFLKSNHRSLESKCRLEVKPGQHGRSSGARFSDYNTQLREKQKLKRIYGLLERQFLRYFAEAERCKGNTGENLIRLLESRLDNVVYRMGFAVTRAEARQLVSHRAVLLNNVLNNVPSCRVKEGNAVSIAEKARGQYRVHSAIKMMEKGDLPAWLDVNRKEMSGVFKRDPDRAEVMQDINENLIVELYSR